MPKERPRPLLAPRRARRSHAILPTPIAAKLAGLAAVSSDEIFKKCVTYAVTSAHTNPARLRGPLYAGPVRERFDELLRATLLIQKLLDAIQNPQDRSASFLRRRLTNYLPQRSLASYIAELSRLAKSVENAKNSAVEELVERGRPPGVRGQGQRLGRFITFLEFGALAAGGGWTLNKNDECGTLIDALELLRPFVPDNFLPVEGKHPYSSYQRILTSARSRWKNKGDRLLFAMVVLYGGEQSRLSARQMSQAEALALSFGGAGTKSTVA